LTTIFILWRLHNHLPKAPGNDGEMTSLPLAKEEEEEVLPSEEVAVIVARMAITNEVV
jgi:hypothetical protein